MTFTNSQNKFGILTKLLHWSIFVIFVLQFFLVYRREYFPKDAPEKLQYILLHKSFGLLVLFLAVLMIVWRKIGTRPSYPLNMSGAEIALAKSVHGLLYLCMLVMPLAGIGMSLYAGYGVSFFGLFTIPGLEKNEGLNELFFLTHQWTSYLIIGLVSLHVFAALYHQFYKRDQVLKRML